MSKILIIDDDPDFAESTRIILESKDYTVLIAEDTKQGLKAIQESLPDLIILDVMMENKAAGFIFCRQLKKTPETAKIPILMLTGMREVTGFFFPGETKNPVFLPVDEFLEKSVEPKILLEKIAVLLEKEKQ